MSKYSNIKIFCSTKQIETELIILVQMVYFSSLLSNRSTLVHFNPLQSILIHFSSHLSYCMLHINICKHTHTHIHTLEKCFIHNNFTINPRWQVIIDFNLGLSLMSSSYPSLMTSHLRFVVILFCILCYSLFKNKKIKNKISIGVWSWSWVYAMGCVYFDYIFYPIE